VLQIELTHTKHLKIQVKRCHHNRIWLFNITNMYQDFFHYHRTQTPTTFRKLTTVETLCLCSVIMQNILVYISDVSHVKLLSKNYMVHLICLDLNRVECEHPKRYTHIQLPQASAIHVPRIDATLPYLSQNCYSITTNFFSIKTNTNKTSLLARSPFCDTDECHL
jgi:hypothetical protein